MTNKRSGIYAIHCTRTGKEYVGSAAAPIRRWLKSGMPVADAVDMTPDQAETRRLAGASAGYVGALRHGKR